MKLDLSSFKKAVVSFEQAIEFSDKLITGDVITPEEKFFRAGVIQNFEFTYELSWKIMQRALKMYANVNEYLNKKELFRSAFKNKLITDAARWFDYYEARNITAHTYDDVKADLVYKTAKFFLKDVRVLLANLEKLND
ncbi:MAG: nucleotidyltransferase substrate binding protein [Endomicrobium sp.]|jgi:nucleotidyltransferase substrate binding protein (TIGR01987 family)|nr:nucleotidyltransferase substrate binding protein [Endomicrobium sp.]